MSSMLKEIVLLAAMLVAITNASVQSISVKGRLACDDKSLRNVHVELKERDTFDPDDSLGVVHSDKEGHFEVSGQEDEFSIEPYLVITHNCDGGVINPSCTITDEYPISKEHINGVYDMGIVSLNIVPEKRHRRCK
ncbi:unnamed protein product [Anisakis simplex]|uniref:Transthyretin-like family protein n=1 Tax=Anisakis simplex TaxID=6269 RepID=A0A0M3JWG1_ANISI|nr:unnamed protein product [Anisakis simplex]